MASTSASFGTSPQWTATRSPAARARNRAGSSAVTFPLVGLPDRSRPTRNSLFAASLSARSTVRLAASTSPARSTLNSSRATIGHSSPRRAGSDAYAPRAPITLRTYPSASASERGRGVVRSSK
eukprot:scaffold3978_cov112-Isochrysis_galbana.AAC.3